MTEDEMQRAQQEREDKKLPSVGARVRIEIEITNTSTWSATTTMAQITKQAKDAVDGIMNKLMYSENSPLRGRVRLVGKPRVIAVLAAEEGKDL